jgi:hypothetical protein
VLRDYDEADFLTSDYLKMLPGEWIPDERRTENGIAVIDAERLHSERSGKFKCGFSERVYFVSDSLKTILEPMQFIGMKFMPTQWLDPIRSFERERIWELSATITLPKLANNRGFVYHDHQEPFTGDYSRPIYIREPPFSQGGGELHYRRPEMEALRPFDLAQTYEWHFSFRHSLIASQRLYLFCRERGLPFTWQPVRLNP